MMICRLSMLTLAAWGGTIASLGAQQAGPALYRVTTGVVVELPGVIRLEGDTISGPIIASDGDTVTVRSGDGRQVTLVRPRRTIVGPLTAGADGTLTVERGDRPTLTIPRGAIAKLERSAGRPSRTRSIGRAFLFGAAGGGAVGLVVGSRCTGNYSGAGPPNCLGEPASSAMKGVLMAGSAGAVIGALTSHQRWIEVPPSFVSPSRP